MVVGDLGGARRLLREVEKSHCGGEDARFSRSGGVLARTELDLGLVETRPTG